LNFLPALNRLLMTGAKGTAVLAMAVIAVVIPYEVFGRYVLGDMPVWSGEVSTFALAWLTMTGSAVGLEKGYQISFQTIVNALPGAAARLIEGLTFLIMIGFLLVMTVVGFQQTLANLRQFSPALGLSMAFPYLSLPVGFAMMLTITLEKGGLWLSKGKTAPRTESAHESDIP
jgi:TRAP-type C4-dicarboxylate transport system permease small subunit